MALSTGTDLRILLDALTYIIVKMEKRVSRKPELFEDILYAGQWREKVRKLCDLEESDCFTDCKIKLAFTRRIVSILTVVCVFIQLYLSLLSGKGFS